MSGTMPIEGNSESGASGANPQTSQPNQPSAEDTAKMRSDLDRALQMLGALQSDKDKAAFRAEQKADTVVGQIERISKYLNLTPQQVQEAQRQSVLDEVVQERISQPQPQVQTPGRVETRSIADELADIDESLELPANDSRTINLKLHFGNDRKAYLKAATVLRDELKNQPSPTAAEGLLPKNQAVSRQPTPSQEKLQIDYKAEQAEIMNKKLPHDARLRELTDLKAKYRAAGLPLNH